MDDKVSTNKIIISLIVFAIISITITAILIIQKNNTSAPNQEITSGDVNIAVKHDKIIGTKINQKYNQNDLEIIETQMQEDGLEYVSIRISGLKNKEIENKINEDIAREEASLKENVLSNEMGEYDSRYLNEYVNANFSNVLSLALYGSKYGSNSRNQLNESRYLNYDLTTGNRLKLEDLFVPGADIDLYAQNSIYKELLHDTFSEKGVFFDPQYWESGECTYVVDEIDELKFIKEFNKYKTAPKDFYFFYNQISIIYGEDYDNYVYIRFKDCMDDLAIFDKFVTEEGIFERDDIGVKNLYVCSNATTGKGYYTFIDDVTSNFRIDARVYPVVNERILESQKYIETLEKLKQDIAGRKNDIKEIAKKNKDKYYYLTINVTINDFIPKYYCTYSEQDITYDEFYVYTEEDLYEVDKTDFSDWFENKLISANYYEMGAGYLNMLLSDDEKKKCKIERKYDSVAYNINSEKVYRNLEDLFKEDSNYLSVIDNVLQREYELSTDQVAKMIKNHEYQLTNYAVEFRNEENIASVRYEEFSPESIK